MADPASSEWGSPGEIKERVRQAIGGPVEKLIEQLKKAKRLLETREMTPADQSALIAELEAVIAAYDDANKEVADRLAQDDVQELINWDIDGSTPPPSGGSAPETSSPPSPGPSA